MWGKNLAAASQFIDEVINEIGDHMEPITAAKRRGMWKEEIEKIRSDQNEKKMRRKFVAR